jgi:hypothetical protein
MSERPGPDLDRVRQALRGHDERQPDHDPAPEADAPEERAEPEETGDEPENVAGAG